ncbi:hypothetical protein M8C21_025922 [Ambrosia artemisiifolia]|uniref:Uncharacterized protein n=1 Tax=Ambrosia artemisiifolia TaxID=4212 RepID=A0AAD5BR87_AMBAR|nr:hypothetical protein M8C21_025922 [Ambrosia artemisiifolia]
MDTTGVRTRMDTTRARTKACSCRAFKFISGADMDTAEEDKLSAGNRSVVNKFESELAQDVGSLCNMVATSVSQQNEQLQCIEKFCDTFINISDKAITDLKTKVSTSRNLYISHIEEMENVIRLRKASANGSLEDIQPAFCQMNISVVGHNRIFQCSLQLKSLWFAIYMIIHGHSVIYTVAQDDFKKVYQKGAIENHPSKGRDPNCV